ncbi:MAG: hypothetical protein GF364_07050 [Candidatus Lokiarchaeota archaeon]|nr:hypothetical protein [Candidatus Lokiarchaeota archaeon]
MGIEDEYYERGLSFLQKDPPNLIRALSFIRKAKNLFEEKGKIKDFNAAVDKLKFIYKTLYERNLEDSTRLLRNSQYRDSILQALKGYRHLLLSEPRKPGRATKKVRKVIQESSIELLAEIERKTLKDGYSEELLNEMYFVAKTIRDVFYPNLKKVSGAVPSDFISKIDDNRKLQKGLINTHEVLGNKARDEAKSFIEEGNIKLGLEMLKLSSTIYKNADFTDKANDLQPLFARVYEAQGDAEFTKGQEMAESGRMNKGRQHIKKAYRYYKKAGNDKKVELAEKNYLSISMKMGELMVQEAKEAERFGDLNAAIEIYDDAYKFFKKINHRKSIAKMEKKKLEIYEKLGDKEYEKAQSLTPESSEIHLSKYKETTRLNLSLEDSHNAECILRRIQHYRDALFYYQKAGNTSLSSKSEKRIQRETEDLAEIILTNARKNLKIDNYEQAFLNFKKALFYYESIRNDRKIKLVKKQINKIHKKIDRAKLEDLERLILEQKLLESEEEPDEEPTQATALSTPIEKKDQYRCKSCGKWVHAYNYDAIQEKCMDCRENIVCDECGRTIPANEPFMQCIQCNARFDIECADRVYDFIQKKCAACRQVQECEICGTKTTLGEYLHTCPECGKDYCDIHWDEKQEVCVNCRHETKCHECGKILNEDEVYTCSECNEIFCSEHFDKGRLVCNQHRDEEVCAKCGKALAIEDEAYKCKHCDFVYCPDHYSQFHDKCHVCLGVLKCAVCGKELFNEHYYTCDDCKDIFCSEHFNISTNRCKECEQISSKCNECGIILNQDVGKHHCLECGAYYCNEHFNLQVGLCNDCSQKEGVTLPAAATTSSTSSSTSTSSPSFTAIENSAEISPSTTVNTSDATPEEANTLIFNTLKSIVQKYNNKEILEPEEINFLHKYQINLPKDESQYVNIGETGNQLVILRDPDGSPHVALTPEIPILSEAKYFGDMMQKLNKYLPDVRETIDGMSSTMNLIFYAANNPKWAWIYKYLGQTLLKPAVEVLNVLMLIFKKTPKSSIIEAVMNSPFDSRFFSGIDVGDAIEFIKTNESEEEIGLFSDDERLDHLLRVFYNLHVGNVMRSCELLSILSIED